MLSSFKYYFMAFIAFILALVYLPIGLVYTLLGYRFVKVYQDSIILGVAITIDILGNICGLPLYHLFADNKNGNTLFCKKGITISAAIGHLIHIGNINKLGVKFSKLLDIVFKEKEHCMTAFKSLNLV